MPVPRGPDDAARSPNLTSQIAHLDAQVAAQIGLASRDKHLKSQLILYCEAGATSGHLSRQVTPQGAR